jgi:hypothetical protein
MFKLLAGGLLLTAVAAFAGRPAYVITGQVLDEKGAAACNVRVCAFAEDFDRSKPNVPTPCALSDPRGQFAVSVERPGKYTLYYSYDGGGYYSPYLPYFRSPSSPAPEVSVGEAGAAHPVTVTMLPRNGLLAGTGVDDETGLPIENLEFTLCHADAPNVCWATSAKSAEGKFKVPAAHVPFTFRVRAEGYEDWLGAAGAERAPVSVAAGTTLELNVRMRRSAAGAGRALGEAEKREGLHLPAPAQKAPADGSVFNHYPRLTRLEWASVEGAASYAVEVDFCSGRRKNTADCSNPQPLRISANPPTSSIEGTAYEFHFVGAQPGRWRVWAVDGEGREGFKSPWRLFVYLQ